MGDMGSWYGEKYSRCGARLERRVNSKGDVSGGVDGNY